MALKAGDHLGTRVLIGPHHVAQVFRIELAGKWGRVHQVTKQHSELAPFSVGSNRCDRGRGWLRQGSRQEGRGQRGGRWRRRQRLVSATYPNQHLTVLIDRQPLTLNEFDREVVQRRVIELKLPLECAVGHPATALEQGDGLVQDLVKGHARPPSAASYGASGPVSPLVRCASASNLSTSSSSLPKSSVMMPHTILLSRLS